MSTQKRYDTASTSKYGKQEAATGAGLAKFNRASCRAVTTASVRDLQSVYFILFLSCCIQAIQLMTSPG